MGVEDHMFVDVQMLRRQDAEEEASYVCLQRKMDDSMGEAHGGRCSAAEDSLSLCDSFGGVSLSEERKMDFDDMLSVEYDHCTQEMLCI